MKKDNIKRKVWLSEVLFAFCLATFFPLVALAQGFEVVRGDCTPDLTDGGVTRGVRYRLPAPNKNWDANRIYKQLVILVSFRDVDFQMGNPEAIYDSIFNKKGYNKRNGVGCVADYFRDQSGGLFNLEFDIYGPIKLDTLACPYTAPTDKTRNYGKDQFRNATLEVIKQYPDIDYKQYDWDGDGKVEQVIYVHAGLSGNQGEGSYGYIWPNTGSFSSVTTPDGTKISNFTGSGELWKNNLGNCGIGTICHEFSHSLGLPDIYPTTSSAGYSVVDEWDLMDGGNFTNYGWCPPNFSPLEKMLFGWLTPIELTERASIKGLKPSADGGEVYQINHSESEWLLLENRQHEGWDLGIPGRGLVIYHVNYDRSVWQNNTVNNDKSKRRYELVHADNMDYDVWDVAIGSKSPYRNKGRLNSAILSTSPYPWTTDSTTFVNNELTDTSVPAAKMNNPNENGSTLLSKPITNIRMSDDGFVSFDFMGGDHDGISSVVSNMSSRSVYNLQGQQVLSPRKGLYIINRKKVFLY